MVIELNHKLIGSESRQDCLKSILLLTHEVQLIDEPTQVAHPIPQPKHIPSNPNIPIGQLVRQVLLNKK